MATVYLFKKPSGGVIAAFINENVFGDGYGKIPLSECPHLTQYTSQGLEYFTMDSVEFFNMKNQCESRAQLYHSNNQVLIDSNWEVKLMPSHLIRNRLVNRLDQEINDVSTSDRDVSLKINEKHNLFKRLCVCRKTNADDLCVCGEELFWLDKAIEGLDARVQNGEADKPVIRQKIADRKQALQNGI